MVCMFVLIYKLPSTHQEAHALLRGRTTFSPTRSVPGTPSLQCWSVLWWRLDRYCRMRALCIVLWLHVFLPHLNTLVWPLPNLRIQVWLKRLFSRAKSIQSSRWPKPYLPQIPLNLWEVWGPTHFLPLHPTRVPPGDIQLLFSFRLHIFFHLSHSCHVLCSKNFSNPTNSRNESQVAGLDPSLHLCCSPHTRRMRFERHCGAGIIARIAAAQPQGCAHWSMGGATWHWQGAHGEVLLHAWGTANIRSIHTVCDWDCTMWHVHIRDICSEELWHDGPNLADISWIERVNIL